MKLIRDAMTERVKLVQVGDTIDKAADIMKEFNVGMLPVVDGESVVGALTDRDIVVRGTAEGRDPSSTKISEIMTKDITACYDDQEIVDVAAAMKEDQVRRIVVLNREEKLAGVISLGDLAGHATPKESGDVLRHVSSPTPAS